MIDVVFPDNEACPDCGCGIFRPGPRAGASQNVECAQCFSRFNISRWHYDHIFDGTYKREGKPPIVWAQRIPAEADGGGEWREDLFPRVLQ